MEGEICVAYRCEASKNPGHDSFAADRPGKHDCETRWGSRPWTDVGSGEGLKASGLPKKNYVRKSPAWGCEAAVWWR